MLENKVIDTKTGRVTNRDPNTIIRKEQDENLLNVTSQKIMTYDMK